MVFLATYTLSKLLPLLVLPLGISFCILFFNLKKNSRRTVFGVLIFLWTFSNGFTAKGLMSLVEYPWKRIKESEAPNADAIVVLSSGGMHKAPGSANILEWNDPDRVFAGIRLFKERKAPKLFFTGGASPYVNDSMTEGDLYKEYAIGVGIPAKGIIITDKVFNTAQEAIEVKKSFRNQKSSAEILLVTTAFHMQRAKKQFERQGFVVYPFPVDFKTSNYGGLNDLNWKNPYRWMPNSASLYNSSRSLREIIGRIVYRSW